MRLRESYIIKALHDFIAQADCVEMNSIKLYDTLGELWYWDGKRVYHLGAEIEMIMNHEDARQNGYPAHTLEEAKAWLD